MPYIQQQVASILAQDYPHFNLVILENASTDGTNEFINSLQHPKISVIASARLLSYDENWRRVATVPKAAYLVCAMADDYYEPDYLTQITQLIAQYPQACVYRTNVKFLDENSKTLGYPLQIKSPITVNDYLKGRFLATYFETFQGYCFRSDYFDKTWPSIPINNGMFSDDAMVLHAICEGGYMPVSPKYACVYRSHPGSISRSLEDWTPCVKGFTYLLKWLDSLKDNSITVCICRYLPFYLEHVKTSVAPPVLKQYRDLAASLFPIRQNNLYVRTINYLRKHFFIHKQGPTTSLRIGPLKLKFSHKE